jgi:hypothetical protein
VTALLQDILAGVADRRPRFTPATFEILIVLSRLRVARASVEQLTVAENRAATPAPGEQAQGGVIVHGGNFVGYRQHPVTWVQQNRLRRMACRGEIARSPLL